MNLFENLQTMSESNEDKIINVKLIDVEVLGDDDDYDAWDEHLNELANEYNITIEANEERSILISGTRKNIEEFLYSEYFLDFDSNHVVVIDTLKESKAKEVYIKSDNNFYIVYDKTNDAELFRALKNGGNHGQTIEDLLKQFNLKLIKESNEDNNYNNFDKKVNEIESKLNELNTINDIYQIVLIKAFSGGTHYFRIGVKSNLLNDIKLNKESKLNDVWIISHPSYKDTIYNSCIIKDEIDENYINEILKAIESRHEDIKNRSNLIEKLVKIGIDKNRMCLYNDDDAFRYGKQLTYNWLEIDDEVFWLSWSTIDEIVDKIQHKIK